MRRGDKQVGFPYKPYENTKANIEALTGLTGGEVAHATDTGENGYYDEVAVSWVWGGGSVVGGGGGVFQRVLSSNLTIADGECLVVTGYIDDGGFDITFEGDAELEVL